MKGIVLAGGNGTRLYPSTAVVSKQLLNVYDKPLIYYPISVLMLAGIREILIITAAKDIDNFKKLLKDGSQFGVKFEYAVQEKPEGIAQAFLIAEDFIKDEDVALILGDNIFYGPGFSRLLAKAGDRKEGATLFAYQVKDAQRFGVVEFFGNKVISIEEKPSNPKSDYAVTGLYFYDNNVVNYAKTLKPSPRGEYEITDLNKIYFEKDRLTVEKFGRGFAWLDTGTPEAMLEASEYVRVIENNQGIKIACLEEVAYRMKYVDKNQLIKIAGDYPNNSYYNYVLSILK